MFFFCHENLHQKIVDRVFGENTDMVNECGYGKAVVVISELGICAIRAIMRIKLN